MSHCMQRTLSSDQLRIHYQELAKILASIDTSQPLNVEKTPTLKELQDHVTQMLADLTPPVSPADIEAPAMSPATAQNISQKLTQLKELVSQMHAQQPPAASQALQASQMMSTIGGIEQTIYEILAANQPQQQNQPQNPMMKLVALAVTITLLLMGNQWLSISTK